MNADETTGWIKRALDIFFIKNPVGTALGLLFGINISYLANIFYPAIPETIVNKDFLNTWKFSVGSCGFGVFIFNFKRSLSQDKIPLDIKNALELVKNMENEGRITKGQASLQYRQLINQVIQSVVLNNIDKSISVEKLNADE